MEGNIDIRMDELARLSVLNNTKIELAHRLVEAYAKTSEFENMLKSIEIDLDDVKKAVQSELTERIIKNWAERQYDR